MRSLTPVQQPREQRISGAFQLILALFIILTGELPTIIRALAFGLNGGAESEFAAAMVTSLARDVLLLAPVFILASHPLGILHPLLLAVVIWPVLTGIPSVIQEIGGWGGIIAGIPVEKPFFLGLQSHSASVVWTSIAKYNGLEILGLLGTYIGFAFFRGRPSLLRRPTALPNTLAVRTVLLALISVSTMALLAFVYSRGGFSDHLASLGRGRFRELAGAGAIVVATDLAAIALYLWIAARPRDVKSPLFLVCLAVVVAGQFISNGSRGSALRVPLMVGLVWALRRQQVPWRVGLLLVPFLFLSLGLLGAVRTSSWVGQTPGEAIATTGVAESFAFAQKEIELRRSLNAPIPIVERGFAVADGPLLGRSYLAAVVAFIPRSIWEDKPRGPDSLYAQMFLGEAREGNAIPVGTTAEMYWNFGFLGVLALSFMYGVLLRVVYHFYWRRYPSPIAMVFYALFVTSFHLSTHALVDFQQQLALLFICYLALTVVIPRTSYATRQIDNRLRGPPPATFSHSSS